MNHKIPYKKDDVLIWKNGSPVRLLEDPGPAAPSASDRYLMARAYNLSLGRSEPVYFNTQDGGEGWELADEFEHWVREVRKDGTGSATS